MFLKTSPRGVSVSRCVLFCATMLLCAHHAPAQDPPASAHAPVPSGDTLAVFVSDTQSPLWPETFRLRPNRNLEARDAILRDILAMHPNAIFHLGDMVSLGLYDRTWERMDAFLASARKLGVPVYPTLGNHELIVWPPYGLANVAARFPWYSSTGYYIRIGTFAVVMLNSNFRALDADHRRRQRAWLEESLAAMEQDSTVTIIALACHHSPFTNSTVVSPSPEVQEEFVASFLRYDKCRVFLSGHAHASEHFRREGKDFIVLGGGGGLQHPLLGGSESRSEDLFSREGGTRMFHYVLCRIRPDTVQLTVRMLNDDFATFASVSSIDVTSSPQRRSGR